MKKISVLLCAMVLTFGVVGTAAAAILVVDANRNIFGAGHSVPPYGGHGHVGVTPISYSFPAASNQVLTFSSVTG